MRAVEIPFVSHTGIEERTSDTLQLSLTKQTSNHVGTIHAAALFALAETQSGVYLQSLFPEYGVDEVLPLLRGSNLKYRAPATSTVYAVATTSIEEQERFLSRFERKGRAGITVEVILSDSEDRVVMDGSFEWFVQRHDTKNML